MNLKRIKHVMNKKGITSVYSRPCVCPLRYHGGCYK